MHNLSFDSYQDYNDFLINLPVIGSGKEGTCRLLDNSWVIKTFNEVLESDFEKYLLQFKDYEIDGVAFIKYLIYIRDIIVASIAPFIKGETLFRHPLSLENINSLVLPVQGALTSIKELSNNNIHVSDVFAANIVYDGSKISFIDTSKYYVGKDAYNHNLKQAMLPIINSTFGIGPFGINAIIVKFLKMIDSKYASYYENYDLLSNPKELLLGIKGELEKYYETEIGSFNEIGPKLKRTLSNI